MYSLINLTVTASDFDIPPCLKTKVLNNPDVEHHNSYATFVIDGRETDCFVAWITTRDYEEVKSGWSSCEVECPSEGTYFISITAEKVHGKFVISRNN